MIDSFPVYGTCHCLMIGMFLFSLLFLFFHQSHSYAKYESIGHDVLEVTKIPERRQEELLAEFERKKKVMRCLVGLKINTSK